MGADEEDEARTLIDAAFDPIAAAYSSARAEAARSLGRATPLDRETPFHRGGRIRTCDLPAPSRTR